MSSSSQTKDQHELSDFAAHLSEHEAAAGNGICCDPVGEVKEFVADLNTHFGYKLLWLLFVVQFLLKGFVVDFIGKAEPYMYKQYGVPAPRMQIYNGITQLPWAFKPIIGLASDILPMRGYNKAPYMLGASILGVWSFLCIGFIPQALLPVVGLVGGLWLIQLQCSTVDLLSEAKYAEKMRSNPSHGPALMTYVWSGVTMGSLAAVSCSGLIIGNLGAPAVYIIASIPAASVLIPLAKNFLEEEPLSKEQIAEVRRRFQDEPETSILCALMLCGTFMLAFIGLFCSTRVTCLAAILVAIVILLSFSVMLSPVIAKFNAFSLIQTSCTLSLSGATFYFYTDTWEQYPEGPHFSPFFYNSVLGVVNTIMSLFGIYCYQRYMSSWTYRNILIATNLGYSILCLPDIILFTRMNLSIGIPDHLFVLGSSVARNIVATWQWMPQVVILSFLCPQGMEATMYALLAGCSNLGGTIASNCGALMLEVLGCSPNGSPLESAQFEMLWVASAISTALPLLAILALFWLIPDARQDENILDERVTSATTGSLWTSLEHGLGYHVVEAEQADSGDSAIASGGQTGPECSSFMFLRSCVQMDAHRIQRN